MQNNPSNNYDKLTIRFITILQRLYEGEILSKVDLADEFNVSQKTIQRDMNSRIGLQLPLKYIRGLGWKLDEDFQMKRDSYQIYSQIIEQREPMKYNLDLNLMKARDVLDEADAILITAGAGMGVDSGLPDFRGTKGFWNAYPPMKKLKLEFVDIANPKWFETAPQLAWGFYGHRLQLYRDTAPHDGFKLLRDLAQAKDDNYFIFTSNVDGQFQKAGFNEQNISECHGSIHFNQCTQPCSQDVWSNKEIDIDVDLTSFMASGELPTCRHCKELARPNILMFGDWGFVDDRTRTQQAKLNEWIRSTVSKNMKIAVIEIGAGKDIPTVRHFSEDIVSQYEATLIRINPRDFDGPDGTISLPLGGQEALTKILSL